MLTSFRSGSLGADPLDPTVCAPIRACVSSAGIYPANLVAVDQDLKAPLNQVFAVSIAALAAAVIYLYVKK